MTNSKQNKSTQNKVTQNKATQIKSTQINQDDVNKAIWQACDTFRGTIDSSIYKDFVLTMLFLKYISDVHQDKHAELVKEFADSPEMVSELMKTQSFIIPDHCTFWDLYERRHEAGNGTRIDQALHAIEEANGTKLKNVFQDISFNTDKLGDEKTKNDLLRHLLEDFGKDSLNLAPSRVGTLDVIGNAYEYLIKHFASTSGKTAGEFYTPPEVSDLLSIILGPQQGDSICDPACGSGSLLMKCGKQVQRKFNGSKQYALYGQESINSTWSLAKMNMFLHGEDNHRIEWGDTIKNPLLLNGEGELIKFDIVTANPPFSLDKWGHEKAEDDHFKRFHRGVPPKTKGDYAFITHMIETLKPAENGKQGGRMGVVVPHGVLFRASAEGKIRQKLIDENLLDAVIGLPEKLFFGTGIPAAILLFRKDKTDNNVLFIDASREFKSGKNQNQLTAENIQKVIDTYHSVRYQAGRYQGLDKQAQYDAIEVSSPVCYAEELDIDHGIKSGVVVDKYAYLASLDEIIENDYNLNIPRYVDTFEEEEEVDLVAVRNERLSLQKELAELEAEMAGYLKELGYE